jgi:Zn-dependent M28 family amino/carboxypeptidase
MKFDLIKTILLLSAAFLFNASAYRPKLYQVTSSHPHDVKEFSPYIDTVKQAGRLWLVHLKQNTPKHLLKYFRVTDGKDVGHYLVPHIESAQASLQIQEFAARIDVNNIKNDVESLASYKTRLVGSSDNQRATNGIKEVFTSLSYSVTEQCYKAHACSIIADKTGESSDEVIMIMAHLDSVGKNFAGADDNASGAAVLLEVARVLKDFNNKKTLRFFATNGEESGLLGAEFYARSLRSSGDIKKMVLAINMDMVGYNSNGIVELETDKQYEGLANWFATLAATYTSLKAKVTIGAWGSDHVPFIKSGVPTLLTIEDWSTKTPCYHLECDKPATLNYVYTGEIAKLNLAAIMTKDAE